MPKPYQHSISQSPSCLVRRLPVLPDTDDPLRMVGVQDDGTCRPAHPSTQISALHEVKDARDSRLPKQQL